MTIILLDTNFLMIPGQFKIDVFTEIERIIPDYELLTLSGIMLELKKVGETARKGRDKISAKIAIQIVENKAKENKIKISESSGDVDEFIVKFAVENGAVVCTNDKELKRKLRDQNVRIIHLRSKSKLEFLN
ncbi:MAG: nucleotide-binding protein [Candidatus Altiarchaeales archaeon HGW-Altiarchaeales-3]|nr:MAG: nucleotide-binding protein [Candidatus Altiarchaeales archaeon HGW-Altiarchaeales-3]